MLVVFGLVKGQNRDAFRCVSGRLKRAQTHVVSQLDRVAVAKRLKVEFGFRLRPDRFLLHSVAELDVTGNKVGVKVRQNHMLDLETVRFRISDVHVDISLRIDDRSDFCRFRRPPCRRRATNSPGNNVE